MLPSGTPAIAQWPQWAGPQRNFSVKTTGLADTWPEDGPPRIWYRELGDGFASAVLEDGVLYTMYRQPLTYEHEYAVALDAQTGRTIWEQETPSPVPLDERLFPGPHSTPLVCGDNLVAIGRNAVIRCWDKKTGAPRWQHDLVAEFGAAVPVWGFSSSPIAYDDKVIVLMGTQPYDGRSRMDECLKVAAAVPDENRASLVAFDQATGRILWKSQSFRSKYTSPILIHFAGRDQLIIMPLGFLVSVDPNDGTLLWQQTLENAGGQVTTPLWMDGDRLFFASTSTGRLLKLVHESGKTMTEELWSNKKLSVHVSAPVRAGGIVVAPKGGEQGAMIVGADLQTGRRLWAQRIHGEAKLLYADGKIIMLDEKGQLTLATATAEGLSVQSTWQLPDWSGQIHCVPTLGGRTLYVRDRKHIMALDLGATADGFEEKPS